MKNKLIRLLGEEDYLIFEKIYRVFERYPFWEKWSDIMLLNAFRDFLSTGKIYCYENIGIMNIQYNKKKLETLPYGNWGNFIYISDVAVLESARNQGIATILMKNLIEEAMINNFDSIYFRTNLENSMIEKIGLKNNFVVLKDVEGKIITDTVSFPRTKKDIPETDNRKYLLRKLR